MLGFIHFPFEVENEWFTGSANLTTYDPNELLGTKLRALYQRRKGRDLFDLHYANQHLELDNDKLIRCYQEYMASVVNKPPTQKQYLQNINEKRNDADFIGDTIKWIKRTIVNYLLTVYVNYHILFW